MKDKAALWARLQDIHEKETEDLRLQKEGLAKERETMGGVTADPSDIVEINAGGQAIIQCHRRTLCLAPDSMFSHLFSGRWDDSWAKDSQGRIFFDHDPELILLIVNHLRIKRIEDPSNPVKPPQIPTAKKAEFLHLLQYFGLHSYFFPKGETIVLVDCSSIEVVQPHGMAIREHARSERELELRCDASNHYFAFCKPSLPCGSIPCCWKVTINYLQNFGWLFLGIIGNQNATSDSYSDTTCYGWAGHSQAFRDGNEISPSDWYGFSSGECLLFRYCENTLSMFSVAKNKLFRLEGIDLPEAYIHFNFHAPTKLTLSSMSEAEQRTMISKLDLP